MQGYDQLSTSTDSQFQLPANEAIPPAVELNPPSSAPSPFLGGLTMHDRIPSDPQQQEGQESILIYSQEVPPSMLEVILWFPSASQTGDDDGVESERQEVEGKPPQVLQAYHSSDSSREERDERAGGEKSVLRGWGHGRDGVSFERGGRWSRERERDSS